jgi:hypothetical protein
LLNKLTKIQKITHPSLSTPQAEFTTQNFESNLKKKKRRWWNAAQRVPKLIETAKTCPARNKQLIHGWDF